MSEIVAWIIMCLVFGGPVALAAFFWTRRDGPHLTPEQRVALAGARKSTAYTAVIAIVVLCGGVLWGGVSPVTWGNAAAVLAVALVLGCLVRLAFGTRLLRDR